MVLKQGSVLVLCMSVGFCFASPLTEKEFLQVSGYQVLVKDFHAAVQTGYKACHDFPDSVPLRVDLIRSLACDGQWVKAVALLKSHQLHENVREQFSLIEEVAWSALRHQGSSSDMHDIVAMMSAAMTNDVKAVSLLSRALDSSNTLFRMQAVRLCERFPDQVLQNKLLGLLRTEKNPFVRLELLNGASRMRGESVKKILEEVVQSSSSIQEMGLAIRALSEQYETIRKQDLDFLLSHSKMGLRGLGAELIYRLRQTEYYPRLWALLDDASIPIRIHVLRTLSFLDEEYLQDEKALTTLRAHAEDPHPYVAILANWLLTRKQDEGALSRIQAFVAHKDTEISSFSAHVLGLCGRSSVSVLEGAFKTCDDPYTKANIALSMIKLQHNVKDAVVYLEDFVEDQNCRCMFGSTIHPMFTMVKPNQAKHALQIPNYPTFVDQMARLELINILCAHKSVRAKELLRDFLEHQQWGVAANAMLVMIQEGDIEAVEVVREIMQESDGLVKIQAALALAFYAKDVSVLNVLQDAYKGLDWDRKLAILEAVGNIGGPNQIGFFLDAMTEPSHIIRTVSASGILRCLYH